MAVSDPSVALAARETLLRMTSDDSRRVAARAQAALEAAEDARDAGRENAENAENAGNAERVAREAEASSPPPPSRPPPVQSEVGSRRRAPVSGRVLVVAGIVAALVVAVVVILVTTGGSGTGHGGTTASVTGGGDHSNFVKIPAGNLTANPSFEHDLSGWDTSGSRLSRTAANDAPNGHYVVRVSALNRSGDYAIDDYPDTVGHSVAGRRYLADAWVRGTTATDGKLVCLALRERAGSQGKLVGQALAGVNMSAADYREIRVAYVTKGTGHRVDVHLYTNRPDSKRG